MKIERQRLSAAPRRASVSRNEKIVRRGVALREKAQSHALKALEALVWLAENAASESVRVSAANAVLDRAHGKPAPASRGANALDEADEGGLEVQWLAPARS